jgi:hypothetical protein
MSTVFRVTSRDGAPRGEAEDMDGVVNLVKDAPPGRDRLDQISLDPVTWDLRSWNWGTIFKDRKGAIKLSGPHGWTDDLDYAHCPPARESEGRFGLPDGAPPAEARGHRRCVGLGRQGGTEPAGSGILKHRRQGPLDPGEERLLDASVLVVGPHCSKGPVEAPRGFDPRRIPAVHLDLMHHGFLCVQGSLRARQDLEPEAVAVGDPRLWETRDPQPDRVADRGLIEADPG